MLLRGLGLLLLAATASADIVHLKSGGKIEGTVTLTDDQVRIETGRGTVTLGKDLVERIEKKESPPPLNPRPPKRTVRLGEPYAHPFHAFKVRLPERWVRSEPHGKAQVSFTGPADGPYQPRMDLHIQATTMDLAGYVAAHKKQFQDSFRDVIFAFEEVSSIHGKEGYQFSVAFTEGEIPLRQQALLTFAADGERKYLLTFNCGEAWFERYLPQVDASMKSLRIHPAAPAASDADRRRFLTHYQKGEAAYRDGRLEEALRDFEEASEILPGFADLHSTIGAVHHRRGETAEAVRSYRKALEIDPEETDYHYNLGLCLLKQSDYDGAIRALGKAAQEDPAVLTNLGAAYLGKNLAVPAHEALVKAVRADPESAAAHYNLGRACERLGRAKEAGREYAEALKIDPDRKDAHDALRRLSKPP